MSSHLAIVGCLGRSLRPSASIGQVRIRLNSLCHAVPPQGDGYSTPYKIIGRVRCTSLQKIMKIKTTFIIFAILVLSFIGLRSGTAFTRQLPHSEKQISNTKSGSFNFLSCFGGSDADDCDDVAVDAAGHIYLACHSLSNDFPGSQS